MSSEVFRRIGERLPAGFTRAMVMSLTSEGREHLHAEMELERATLALRAVTSEQDREAVADEVMRRGGRLDAFTSVYHEVIRGEFPPKEPVDPDAFGIVPASAERGGPKDMWAVTYRGQTLCRWDRRADAEADMLDRQHRRGPGGQS